MRKLTGLAKKEFANFWGEDGSKNGSAWQKVEKEIALLCHFEKTGKNRGIRYNILEIFDKPKEKIHGNTGKEPAIKGTISKKSQKYKMAKALIEISNGVGCVTKNGHLAYFGFKSKNMEGLEKKFSGTRYNDLKPIEQYVYKQTQAIHKSLNRMITNAFKLIDDGIFDNATIDEQLMVVLDGKTHIEAHEALDDAEGLYSIFLAAKEQARKNVELEYGKNLFFATAMKFENDECEELISSDERFQALLDNDISFFYKRYAVITESIEFNSEAGYDYEAENYDGGPIMVNYESIAEEFFMDFLEYKKYRSNRSISKSYENGDEICFLNEETMIEFSEDLWDFMFENAGNMFTSRYNELIESVEFLNAEKLTYAVNESMAFLPNKIDFKAS